MLPFGLGMGVIVDNKDWSRSVSVRLYGVTEVHENRTFGVCVCVCVCNIQGMPTGGGT
jgi:hypothetical protein